LIGKSFPIAVVFCLFVKRNNLSIKAKAYCYLKKISTHLLIMEVDFCPVLCIPEVPVLQAFRGISHFVWYCKAVSDLS
jgi:hypothetical protein